MKAMHVEHESPNFSDISCGHFYVLKLVILRIAKDGGNGLCNFMFENLFIFETCLF